MARREHPHVAEWAALVGESVPDADEERRQEYNG